MHKLSIVIPVFNEPESVGELTNRLKNLIASLPGNIDVEVVFVDDHSTDGTPKLLGDICTANPSFKFIRLSRNSGSHVAIIAGLSLCSGDSAVFLAADLQDPPELIAEMLAKWMDGDDVVWAVRDTREGVSAFSLFLSNLFYKIFNNFSSVSLPPTGVDFALLDRKVITGVINSAGSKPSLGGLIAWLGFKQSQISYVKRARKFGQSKWTLSKKLNAFADAFVGFSYVPMRLMTYLGFIISSLGFLYALIIIALRIISGKQIEGWASLMVVVLALGGIQMLILGILGEYLWRNLEESRKRPLFFIEDKKGFE